MYPPAQQLKKKKNLLLDGVPGNKNGKGAILI
jgi:hypothetical protein